MDRDKLIEFMESQGYEEASEDDMRNKNNLLRQEFHPGDRGVIYFKPKIQIEFETNCQKIHILDDGIMMINRLNGNHIFFSKDSVPELKKAIKNWEKLQNE